MTDRPTLTVALPTFQGARHLAEALRSILAQQGADFELIVSDDRSEDDTIDIVRQLAGDRARIAINSERLGLAGNWNRCMELARTPWVNIFHQDDVMRPGHLARHLEVIPGMFDKSGLVASVAEVIDDSGEPVPESVVEPGRVDVEAVSPEAYQGLRLSGLVTHYEPGSFVPALAVGNPMRCSAVTIAKEAHADLGGFDPSYRYALDWDFWLRLARSYAVSWIVRPTTVAFRWHLASETHTFKRGTLDLDEQIRLLDVLDTEATDQSRDVRLYAAAWRTDGSPERF